MFLSACVLAILPGAGLDHNITAVATTDGKLLFVAMTGPGEATANTGSVTIWDLTKPELKAVVTGLPNGVRTIRPTADGKRFVAITGTEWNVSAIEVWDTATKKRLHAFELPARGQASMAAVSPDGNWVVYRTAFEMGRLRVWFTENGKRSETIEKTASDATGSLVFSTDSKRLIVADHSAVTEIELATGTVAGTWKPTEKAPAAFREHSGWVAVLPNGKGIVSVAGTGKRRQSYAVRVVTKQREWALGELWDHASAPVISPDGRLLLISGGGRPNGAMTYALKLDADGNPELEEKTDKRVGPSAAPFENKVAAWREWPVGEATRAGRESPEVLAFSPDGKRLFVSGSLGKLHVLDTERRVSKATLFAARPMKDEGPAWHILSAAGEVVGSTEEVETLVKGGKVRDAVKVKEALGVK